MILGIDPGNIESAFVVLDENLKPIDFGKLDNQDLLDCIYQGDFDKCSHGAVEMVANMGMPAVGESLFETCVWIGRFIEALNHTPLGPVKYIYRKEEKINLCGSMKAKDSNIRQALIDRFAEHDFKNGKGTKNNKDWFYGFKADIWSAMAVSITYHDLYLRNDGK